MVLDLNSLFIGVLGSAIFAFFVKCFNSVNKYSLKSTIEDLEFEREHLQKISRSSVAMSRSSFNGIFALFVLFGFINLISLSKNIIVLKGFQSTIIDFFILFLWGLFIGLAYIFWKRFQNLKNLSETLDKIDMKLDKKKDKLEQL